LATAVQTNAGGSEHNTPPLRSNDSRVHSLPNRTTSVRTTRACRCTSLYNSRAQFRAIAGTPNRNERSTRTRAASPCLHTTHRNSAPRVAQLRGRFSEIEDSNRV
jgi:hypothetical protein